MFKQLLISLHQRLTETAKDDAAMERAKALNWVDEQKNWRHLHWNPAQQRLEIDNGLRPISTEDLLAQLVQMRKAVTEDTLLRFKSVKRLTTEVTAEWIQFQIINIATPGGRSHLEYAQPVDRAGVQAHIGLPPAEGSTGVRQSHPADLEPALNVIPGLKALLRLVLHNPTNLGYLHSTIFAAHWTMLQARLHDARVPPPPQVFTMLCPPSASTVVAPVPVQVLQSLPWLLMLRAWRDVHRQHDAAEFAMYFIPRISPMGMYGCWEARNYAPRGTVTLDRGSLHGGSIANCT